MILYLYVSISEPKMPGDNDYQVNLEELIEEYVWDCFQDDMGFISGIFNRKPKFYFDIRWGYLDFSHTTENKERPVTGNVNQRNVEEYENKTNTKQGWYSIYNLSRSYGHTSLTSFTVYVRYL